MQEGLAGAERSVNTAECNEQRLKKELDDYQGQIVQWTDCAKQALQATDEAGARDALTRKHEFGDLIAGLEQQHAAEIEQELKALKKVTRAARRQVTHPAGVACAPDKACIGPTLKPLLPFRPPRLPSPEPGYECREVHR